MIAYGPTNENISLIREKAKSKKDGVYQFRGMTYRVKNHVVTHYTWRGGIFSVVGHFDIKVGGYTGFSNDAARALKNFKD